MSGRKDKGACGTGMSGKGLEIINLDGAGGKGEACGPDEMSGTDEGGKYDAYDDYDDNNDYGDYDDNNDYGDYNDNNDYDDAEKTDNAGRKSGAEDMYEISEAYGILEPRDSGKRKKGRDGGPGGSRDKDRDGRPGKAQGKGRKGAFRVVRRVILVLVTFAAVTFVGAYSTLWVICHGTSKAAKNLFVSTILETGALKFLATWYFTDEEILAITNENSMAQIYEDVNTGLISVQSPGIVRGDGEDLEGGAEGAGNTGPGGSGPGGNGEADEASDGVRIEEIAGRSFMAKMMIVSDPSRVKLATIYPWSDDNHSKDGKTLGELVTQGNYLAGVNGGEYFSSGNWGGKPKGLVVCGGEIQYNVPQRGDVMIGFNTDNILVIKEIGNMTAEQVKAMVEQEKIRDAVSFKDVKGNNNHFTKLLINGKAREINGSGSGANPRTAIGQREDGTVLLLVTDGRGASGHLGATAADLIAIMQEYGAVNAANLDGGSSSAMYYDGVYEMTSVTLYYSTSSWKLPTAYVVERREEP